MKDFIETYDNALSGNICTKLINEFEGVKFSDDEDEVTVDSPRRLNVERTFKGNKLKSSQDLTISLFRQDYFVNKIIMSCLLKYSRFYLNKNPELKIFNSWGLSEKYTISKYKPNQGYFGDHFENSHDRNYKRTMAWMIYLNTVVDNGGTYFTNYDKTVNAVQGKLVIWPAYWTHTHRGIPSATEIKYIATGWYDADAAFSFYPQFIS